MSIGNYTREQIGKECPCGRSPTGVCIGWHSLSEEQLVKAKEKWERLQKKKENKSLNETQAQE